MACGPEVAVQVTEGGLHGLVPSLCTPFDARGELDTDALARLAQFALDAGADGVACTALAGETGELCADERLRAVTAVVEQLGDRLPVIVGVGADEAADAERFAKDAERCGAAAIMLPLPAARTASATEREEALVQVGSAVSLPVMVQDAPAYVGVEVGAHVVARAAERASNIRHLKVEGGSRAVEMACSTVGRRLAVWGGDGGRHLLDCLRSGAVGVIPGVEVVDVLVAAVRAETSGHPDVADERFRQILPWLVFAMESLPQYVACAKVALVRRRLLAAPVARIEGASLGPRAAAIASRHLDAVVSLLKPRATPND